MVSPLQPPNPVYGISVFPGTRDTNLGISRHSSFFSKHPHMPKPSPVPTWSVAVNLLGSLPLPLTPRSGWVWLKPAGSGCSPVQILESPTSLRSPCQAHKAPPGPAPLLPALSSSHSLLLTLLQPPWPPHGPSNMATTVPPGECACCPLWMVFSPDVQLDGFSLTFFRSLQMSPGPR